VIVSDKHTSLLYCGINYDRKKFYGMCYDTRSFQKSRIKLSRWTLSIISNPNLTFEGETVLSNKVDY